MLIYKHETVKFTNIESEIIVNRQTRKHIQTQTRAYVHMQIHTVIILQITNIELEILYQNQYRFQIIAKFTNKGPT